MRHAERHRQSSVGWLRAAVLGANDGLISTSSLILGVAVAGAGPRALLVTGVAGLAAGALSMAAGEYVSVSSQADTEQADVAREKQELATDPDAEHRELTGLYVARGLTPELAAQVAKQLAAHDALGAHLRDELGITERSRARPVQAALASAFAFSVGAWPPILLALALPATYLPATLAVVTMVLLGALGATAANLGGAPLARGALRVGFWGALAMGATTVVGSLFGVAPG